jgi:hypothetical protein
METYVAYKVTHNLTAVKIKIIVFIAVPYRE